jgi:hypothetical protein
MSLLEGHKLRCPSVRVHNPGPCSSLFLRCEHSQRTTKVELHTGSNEICMCHCHSSCTIKASTKLVPREQILTVGIPKYGRLELVFLTQEQGKINWGPLIPSLQSLCRIACTVLEQEDILKNRELVPPAIANMVQTKYKICYIPRCRYVNIYSCTQYCPIRTNPCMLDLQLNSWPVGHVNYLEESENLIRQSKHRTECDLRAERAAQ